MVAALGEEEFLEFRIPHIAGTVARSWQPGPWLPRWRGSSSRLRARSKAWRAMAFSAGDHFSLRMSV